MKFSIFNLQFSLGRHPAAAPSAAAPASLARTKSGLDPAAWLRGTAADDDDSGDGAKLLSPYSQSAWVYIAISVLAENVAQIPFRITRVPFSARKEFNAKAQRSRDAKKFIPQRETNKVNEDENFVSSVSFCSNFRKRVLAENIIESGPVVDLFDHPHPSMDRSLFFELLMSWRSLRGEFFILPLDEQDQPVDLSTFRTPHSAPRTRIRRLLTLSPDLFWHIVVGDDLQGWRYTGSPLLTPIPSQVLLPSEVIHSRAPNPYLYWRGMSPLLVAMLPAASDYAAEQFMKGLMINNADTGVIVTTKGQFSAEQREEFKATLRERKRKAGTADRPLFLWNGAKVEKPAISSADMQFLENRKLNRQEIGAIFKVPEQLMGFDPQTGSLGGGGAQEQMRLMFLENTLWPHCRRIEAALDPIVKSFGSDLYGFFDIEAMPLMQEARRARLDSASKAFAMGAPFNDINQVYDLGFRELAWGDRGYLPFSLQEVDGQGTAPGGRSETQRESVGAWERAERWLDAVASRSDAPTLERSHVWSVNPESEASIRSSIKLKKSRLSRFFFEQRNRVLARLQEMMKGDTTPLHQSVSAGQADPTDPTDPTDVFDLAAEDALLKKKLDSLLVSDLEFGGAQLYKEIGLDKFELAPKDALAFLEKRAGAISRINQQTWDKIKSSLQQGLQNGETPDELADRVKAAYQGFSDAQAESIAVSETNAAVNSGRFSAMKAAKVPRKGWHTSRLENSHASHVSNGEFSAAKNGIPIDQPWPNGCMFPGDPDGDPSETSNCRCVGHAILKKPDQSDPSDPPARPKRFGEGGSDKPNPVSTS
jgi:HK97 family phage portal protein